MKLFSESYGNGEPIPGRFAFCAPDPDDHVTFSENRNPHVRWTDAPELTRSFALIMHDPDVPSVGDDVNQEGRSVPAGLPRVDFFHWVLAEIPVEVTEIPEGAVSSEVTPRGKPVGPTRFGREGRNDYTAWFEEDPDMGGEYGGYDGPCPPWNDERLHHYHITVYALDVERLELPESFGGPALRTALEGHVLASAEWVGTYTLNPNFKG
jgi:Raf kinase inhibitor-like YbhB/YbcL family protein